MESWWIGAAIIFAEIIGILTAFRAVMVTRTAQGATAWAMALITFPLVSVPLYWIFGRNKFLGYVTARRAADRQVGHQGADVEALITRVRGWSEGRSELSTLEQLVRLPATAHNRTRLLLQGQETFGAIFDAIDKAENYVLVQFYIVRDDELGGRMKKLLIKKAKEGVQVYFLYDEIGSPRLRKYGRELREGGVDFRSFYSNRGPRNRFQINFRNHRKVVVVDGKTAFIGGHNLGEEYLGRDLHFGFWRDTHVEIEGPAAIAAQLSFVEDWHWSSGKLLPLKWEPHRVEDKGATVLILPTGPSDELETCGLFFTHMVHSAKKRFWISSPYFVPDGKIMSALLLAALRGVDVRILIPEKADHLLVWLAAFYYTRFAIPNGIKVYRYRQGFLHQKVMLVDDEVSSVGTANFDNRSFRLNFEITALFESREFADEIEKMFLDDFECSEEMQADAYDKRGRLFKLSVGLARLFAPVL